MSDTTPDTDRGTLLAAQLDLQRRQFALVESVLEVLRAGPPPPPPDADAAAQRAQYVERQSEQLALMRANADHNARQTAALERIAAALESLCGRQT